MYWSLNSPACCYYLVSSGCKWAAWWTSYKFSSTMWIITVRRPMLIRITSSHSLIPRVILTSILCNGFVWRWDRLQGYFNVSFKVLVKESPFDIHNISCNQSIFLFPESLGGFFDTDKQTTVWPCDTHTYIHALPYWKYARQFASLRIRK